MQIRSGETDRGRGVRLGGGARGLLCRGGGVCEYDIDEKRGGSVHLRGTVLDIGGHGRSEEKRGSIYVFVVGTLG